MGFRYRLHSKNLPGKPDLVFASRRKVIFVHGCFWHGHDCKRGARIPKANADYWIEKVDGNRSRDVDVKASLEADGWQALTLWECDMKNIEALKHTIAGFLSRR